MPPSGDQESGTTVQARQKALERGRCPACGRRGPRKPSRRAAALREGEAGDLQQLTEILEIGEAAALLGISRWELERRCQSLGIHIRGAKEIEE